MILKIVIKDFILSKEKMDAAKSIVKLSIFENKFFELLFNLLLSNHNLVSAFTLTTSHVHLILFNVHQ